MLPLEKFTREDFNELQYWVNHSIHSGEKRSDLALKDAHRVWKKIFKIIKEINAKKEKDKVEQYFMDNVLYTGNLFRYHKNTIIGIQYSNNYQSWTKSVDPNDIYWLHPGDKVMRLEAVAKENNPGIDLIILDDFFSAVYKHSFIGNVNLYNEQEVVFPITRKSLISKEVIIVPDKQKKPSSN